jgi:RHS repeat-associated protein
MTTETRTIAGISKSTSYGYNLNSSIKTLTYPSGRIVTYTPDAAGELVSAVDNNGTNYITSALYNPDGSLKSFLNGSTPNLNSSFQYNSRLQLCRITTLTSGTLPTSCTDSQHVGNVMDRGYDFHLGNGASGSGTDNGTVMAITNYRDTSRSQGFTYDALNRITAGWSSANTGNYSWGENYAIDAWGNLQISPMGGKAHGGTFALSSTVQNQPAGLGYDIAGNLLTYGSASYLFDPENRMASTAGMSYTYDGNGERVLKSQTVGGAPVKQYWSIGGNTLTETDGSGNPTADYIYLGGKRVARIDLQTNTVHYYLSDHINSTSMVVSAAGVVEEESDYYPFGTEVPVTGSETNRYKFTGKERDTESGLDDFGKRYYGNAIGRFITPDPLLNSGHPWNPQSWNRYAYVENNPLRYTDPTGLYKWGNCSGNADQCKAEEQRFRDSITKAKESLKNLDPNSKEAKELKKTLNKLGEEGKGNIKINFGDASHDKNGNPNLGLTVGNNITINYNAVDSTIKAFNLNASESAALDAGVTTHEGTHAGNAPGVFSFLGMRGEHAAYFVESVTYQGLHNTDRTENLWNESWLTVDKDKFSIERDREHSIQQAIHQDDQQGKQDNKQQ